MRGGKTHAPQTQSLRNGDFNRRTSPACTANPASRIKIIFFYNQKRLLEESKFDLLKKSKKIRCKKEGHDNANKRKIKDDKTCGKFYQ